MVLPAQRKEPLGGCSGFGLRHLLMGLHLSFQYALLSKDAGANPRRIEKHVTDGYRTGSDHTFCIFGMADPVVVCEHSQIVFNQIYCYSIDFMYRIRDM